jgi:hypothetical protein
MSNLMIAIMYSDNSVYEECKTELTNLFGEIEIESKEYDFDKFTSYYEKEMGKNILKRFLIFKKQVNKQDLKEIKLKTTEIEKKHSKEDKRTINLDPGYLSKNELVLASFKKGSNYKEDLGDGIYAHKVLEFKDDKAIELWHTFPDYKEKKELFLDYI